MIAAVDPEYDQLLHKIQPRVPRNREENRRLLAEIEKLMRKGEDKLTPAEDAMLATLFTWSGSMSGTPIREAGLPQPKCFNF